ncbi:MAG TPA: hypothetical protein VGC29_11300 [Flavisolibacter sp.]
MKKFFITAVVLVLIIFSNCKKKDIDVVSIENNTEENRSQHGNNPCDFSKVIVQAAEQGPEVWIKKQYDNYGRIISVKGVFFQTVGVGSFPLLKIKYRPGKIILLNESETDTMVVYYLDRKGNPAWSLSINMYQFTYEHPSTTGFVNTSEAIATDQTWLLRYRYHQGRISEIQKAHISEVGPGYDTTWLDEHRFSYDHKKNLLKLVQPKLIFGGPPSSMSYYYDHSRKAKAQYYPDSKWFPEINLPEYLGLFPELNPVNVLVKAYWQDLSWTDLNGPIFYKHHAFDTQGRLVSYQSYRWWPQRWKLKWNCPGVSNHLDHE